MKTLTGTHVTIMVCTTILVLGVLVFTGKVIVPQETAHEMGALIVGVVAGWLGIRRPGDVPRHITEQPQKELH